jgi:hypothetical protein
LESEHGGVPKDNPISIKVKKVLLTLVNLTTEWMSRVVQQVTAGSVMFLKLNLCKGKKDV